MERLHGCPSRQLACLFSVFYAIQLKFYVNFAAFYIIKNECEEMDSFSCLCIAWQFVYFYSRPLLSRLRLSRITAYLEEKTWSLFWHKNLTSGNKILWMRGEIAPQEQFLPFPHYFQHIFLTKGVKLHDHLWNLVVRLVFFSILQIWFVEVRISRSV